MSGYYNPKVTLADVRAAKPEMIFYSVNTCWWTHDPRHLCRHPTGLPCDPRGGMLMQTDKPERFLASAAKNPTHYGRHGLRAFEAAHHENVQVSESDVRATCFKEWEDYNRLIDEHLDRTGATLPMWVVYESPKDFPGKFVTRRWLVLPGCEKPQPDRDPVAVCDTLEEARAAVRPGSVRLERHDLDDACIVEVWL